MQAQVEWASAPQPRRRPQRGPGRVARAQPKPPGDRRRRATQPRAEQHARPAAAAQRRRASPSATSCAAVAAAHGLDKLGHLTVMWWDAIAGYAGGRPRRLPAPARRVGELDAVAQVGHFATGPRWRCWPRRRVAWPTVSRCCRRTPSSRRAVGGSTSTCSGCSSPRSPATRPTGDRHFELVLASEPISDDWFALGTVLQAVMCGARHRHPARRDPQAVARRLPARPAVARRRWSMRPRVCSPSPRATRPRPFASLAITVAGARDNVARPIEGSLRLALAQALLAEGRSGGGPRRGPRRGRVAVSAGRAGGATGPRRCWPDWRAARCVPSATSPPARSRSRR